MTISGFVTISSFVTKPCTTPRRANCQQNVDVFMRFSVGTSFVTAAVEERRSRLYSRAGRHPHPPSSSSSKNTPHTNCQEKSDFRSRALITPTIVQSCSKIFEENIDVKLSQAGSWPCNLPQMLPSPALSHAKTLRLFNSVFVNVTQ